MKIIFDDQQLTGVSPEPLGALAVAGETARLTDVLLCKPAHLAPVPCCSVTRESLRDGFATSASAAAEQHRALQEALTTAGMRCHLLPPQPGMPDLCFTRDIAVTTPWGLVALNPAMPHRAEEAAHLARHAERLTGAPVTRITAGTIEGGDICIARPGLLILGVSGERTSMEGAEAFARRFRAEGWDVLLYRYDPHFLHLDTIFCMIDETHALGCIDVLDDAFLEALADRGIEVLPVTYKEARRLGCNIVSIDGRTMLAGSATPRVSQMLRDRGWTVVELDISQFAACGGGIHCLTMPLRRN